jgi:hypothetical protein
MQLIPHQLAHRFASTRFILKTTRPPRRLTPPRKSFILQRSVVRRIFGERRALSVTRRTALNGRY